MQVLTDAIIKSLPAPEKGLVIHRDEKVRGLGVRVLSSGMKAFVLEYTSKGKRKVYTLQRCSEWDLKKARQEATDWKDRMRLDRKDKLDKDPAENRKKERDEEKKAITVKQLCDAFTNEYLPQKRSSTQRDYARMIKNDIIPALGKMSVVDVQYDDIQTLHAKIEGRGSKYAAKGCVVLCKLLFNWAMKTKLKNWVGVNPAKGVSTATSKKRQRYLSNSEIAALTKALDACDDEDTADIFRLLMFTGARRGETQSATWDQMNLRSSAPTWIKPAHSTKQNKEHAVPLPPLVLTLLVKRRSKADAEIKKLEREMKAKSADRDALKERARRIQSFVFPSRDSAQGHIVELKRAWAMLCKAAKIKGARIHDLRHTAASLLASDGATLIEIGKQLGHTQPSTTNRYAHLVVEAQRGTANKLAAALTKASMGKTKK